MALCRGGGGELCSLRGEQQAGKGTYDPQNPLSLNWGCRGGGLIGGEVGAETNNTDQKGGYFRNSENNLQSESKRHNRRERKPFKPKKKVHDRTLEKKEKKGN